MRIIIDWFQQYHLCLEFLEYPQFDFHFHRWKLDCLVVKILCFLAISFSVADLLFPFQKDFFFSLLVFPLNSHPQFQTGLVSLHLRSILATFSSDFQFHLPSWSALVLTGENRFSSFRLNPMIAPFCKTH